MSFTAPQGTRAIQFLRFGYAGVLSRDVGWYKRAESYEAALKEVTAIRLLSEAEFRRLFPDGRLCRERFLGLAKSFTIYHGWD